MNHNTFIRGDDEKDLQKNFLKLVHLFLLDCKYKGHVMVLLYIIVQYRIVTGV